MWHLPLALPYLDFLTVCSTPFDFLFFCLGHVEASYSFGGLPLALTLEGALLRHVEASAGPFILNQFGPTAI